MCGFTNKRVNLAMFVYTQYSNKEKDFSYEFIGRIQPKKRNLCSLKSKIFFRENEVNEYDLDFLTTVMDDFESVSFSEASDYINYCICNDLSYEIDYRYKVKEVFSSFDEKIKSFINQFYEQKEDDKKVFVIFIYNLDLDLSNYPELESIKSKTKWFFDINSL